MSRFNDAERHLLTRAAECDGWLGAHYAVQHDEKAAYNLIRAGLAEWALYQLLDCWRLTDAGMKAAAELGGAS